MGVRRYRPGFVCVKGATDKAAYFGHRLEGYQRQVKPFWVATAETASSGSVDAIQKAIDHIRRLDGRPRRIGVEIAFLPLDAGMALRSAFPDVEIVDGLIILERQRARKSADELQKLRIASDRVIDSMLAVVEKHGPGTTKLELTEALRREETNRGLIFEYCLIAEGTSHNRAPSEQKWKRATFCRSIPAAITTAISATSPAWRYSASPMPSSTNCSQKSNRSSGRPSRRSRPAPSAAISMQQRSRWCVAPASTTTCISSPTAWASSATKRPGSPAAAPCRTATPPPIP